MREEDRMPTVSAVAAALTILLTGAAGAQTVAPNAPASEPAQKLICVRGQAETGSHFGASKVCHTESEWAMIHNQSSHTMEQSDTLQNRQPTAAGGH
jgi:hypothetical protein